MSPRKCRIEEPEISFHSLTGLRAVQRWRSNGDSFFSAALHRPRACFSKKSVHRGATIMARDTQTTSAGPPVALEHDCVRPRVHETVSRFFTFAESACSLMGFQRMLIRVSRTGVLSGTAKLPQPAVRRRSGPGPHFLAYPGPHPNWKGKAFCPVFCGPAGPPSASETGTAIKWTWSELTPSRSAILANADSNAPADWLARGQQLDTRSPET